MYYIVEMPMTPNNRAELKNGLWFTTTDANGYEVAESFVVGDKACVDTDKKVKKHCAAAPTGPTDPNTPTTGPTYYAKL
jgi:hypothetical protein